MSIIVRAAELADVPGIARVHVESWRETYRGLFADEVLDDPDFVGRRERFWRAVLTDERSAGMSVAAALLNGEVVGVASSGPVADDDVACDRQLYVLYTYAAVHGERAGSALLAAVLDPNASAVLWVADPNPRAQAFYRKHGFAFDGMSKTEGGVRELRMRRFPPGDV
ncbi:GNAT family N-acetyltransferase [Gryllotalpicola reticulitermitis]|uniref:GNAT family N-acetyltransferase n=1 Tax=Gryllotalpicola reticulitermitis TaxID=1184153 RepID=A0ABV8QAA5_9MICO